jgi:hypothetical protein
MPVLVKPITNIKNAINTDATAVKLKFCAKVSNISQAIMLMQERTNLPQSSLADSLNKGAICQGCTNT